MQKPLTQNRLKNIALFYLERFDASSGKIRQILKRRIQRQKNKGIELSPEITQWVENVIQDLLHLGYLNDKRYVENAIRRLSQNGKSIQYIRQKLRTENIETTLIDSCLTPQTDLQNARQFVRKKHLGNNSTKDLAKLARAGFDYETAKTALEEVATSPLFEENTDF